MNGGSHYLRGLVLAALGMLVISPDGLLLRLVDGVSLWNVMFWRALGMAVTLGLFQLVRYGRRLPAVLRSQGWVGVAVAVAMTLGNYLFVGAMQTTSVANTLVIVATMPFWSALFGLALIGEAVRRRTWVAIAAALGGMVILVSGSAAGEGGGATLGGDALALGAAMALALELVILRKAGDRDMTAALTLAGVLSALVALPLIDLGAVPGAAFPYLLLMGFGTLPVALALFYAGARYAPAAEVALLSLVETVLGPVWVWAVLDEAPGPRALLGGGVVVAAIAGNAMAGLWAAHRGRHGDKA